MKSLIKVSLAALTILITACGTPGAGFNTRGIEATRAGEYTQAIEWFGKAIELNPSESDYVMNRGIAYYSAERYESALKDFDRALELNPNNARAYLNRGNLYDDTGHPERAIQDFGQAIRLDPQNAMAYRNRAVGHIREATINWLLTILTVRSKSMEPTLRPISRGAVSIGRWVSKRPPLPTIREASTSHADTRRIS